ncbi:MAG: hypothetical protein ABSD62_13475, partial [Candidatus Limnocylindrales bacterium]
YLTKQSDIDGNKTITNTAIGHGFFGTTAVDSAEVKVDVSAGASTTGLLVTKTPSQTTYDAAGVTITYTYTLKNTGNVSLTGPFSVTDDPLGTIACAGTTLAPNATTTLSDQAVRYRRQQDDHQHRHRPRLLRDHRGRLGRGQGRCEHH